MISLLSLLTNNCHFPLPTEHNALHLKSVSIALCPPNNLSTVKHKTPSSIGFKSRVTNYELYYKQGLELTYISQTDPYYPIKKS